MEFWKDVNVHIENLVPGVILGWLFYNHTATPVGPPPASQPELSSESLSAFAFLCGCYGLGVISAVVSRFILDGLSERGPRQFMLFLLSHRTRKNLQDDFVRVPGFDDDVKRSTKSWLMFRCRWLAEWNAIYRAALRSVSGDKSKAEIYRRRAQGRLVRNLVAPLVVASALYPPGNLSGTSAAILAGCLGVLLYAYAELNNFAEAVDISEQQALGERQETTRAGNPNAD